MPSKDEKLLFAKQRLMQALGENQTIYLANIKLWFRQKWTKEEFDTESRKLLGADMVHYHNQFFLALLNKVETLSQPQPSVNETISIAKASGKKRKRSSRTASDRATFEPVEVFDYLPDECPDIVRPPSTPGGSSPPPMMPQRFSVQELFLPDAGLVMGRLLVGAWEMGLVSADDNVSDLIVLAVQMLLKNVITSMLMKKKHYRVTSAGNYIYDIGHPMKDPTVRNTLARQQIDDAPADIDKAIISSNINRPQVNDDTIFLTACEDVHHRPKRRLNILDLYKTLLDKQVIPAHSVHAINVERISQMLN